MKRNVSRRLLRINQVMTMQNRGDRARRGDLLFPKPSQTCFELAASPGRMFLAQLNDFLLHLLTCSPRRAVRSSRHIAKVIKPLVSGSPKPLVASLSANPKPGAKTTEIPIVLTAQKNELSTLRHERFLFPRHPDPPFGRMVNRSESVTHVSEHLLPMSPGYTTSPAPTRWRNCPWQLTPQVFQT